MKEDIRSAGVNERIAERIRELRAGQGLSLEALSARTGVSRSMISVIERAESSPTAVVLEKLAAGLGVALAALFEAPSRPGHPVSRHAEQAEWRDPASGYLRRNVSPANCGSPIQIVEVLFPPGARIAYETGTRGATIHQQVWLFEGALEVVVGAQTHRLKAGDCLAFRLDQPTAFHNPARKPARYAVVIASEPPPRSAA